MCIRDRRHEVDVAAAAHAALGHGDAFAVVREVGDELAHFLRFFEILVDDRAHRHLEHKVLAGGSVHARALAVRAALGFEMVLEAVFDERGDVYKRQGYGMAMLTGADPVFCLCASTAALVGGVMRQPLMTVLLLFLCFPVKGIVVMLAAAALGAAVPLPKALRAEQAEG